MTSLFASSPGAPPDGASPAPGPRPSGAIPLTLGRRLALAFGVPAVVFVILITGFQIVANLGRASFQVSRTLPVTDGRFTLNDDGGDVDLHGMPPATAAGVARVTGTVNYSLVHPKVIWDDGTSRKGAGIRLGCPLASLANCELNAHVDLPASTVVKASTGGGNITASSLSGAVTLQTSGGDVTASDLTGAVNVDTGGGNVSVARVSGKTHLHTSGGDITGTGIKASDVTADTGGGNVGLTLIDPPANLSVTTSGGDITIIVPAGVTYAVTTSTSGGDINDLVDRSSSSPYRISASTGGGNITIKNAPA
jgi:hypothetical protein